MKRYLSLFILLLFCVPVYSQAGLEVVSTVIPPRSLPAQAVGGFGQVDVLVTIDAEGNVVSADPFKGHPLLKNISRAAAVKWKFGKDANSAAPRTAHIIFNFLNSESVQIIEKSENKTEAVASANFLTPFWVEITTTNIVPELLLLPREKGKVTALMCLLHQEEMMIDIVKTSIYSDPGSELENYEEAEKDEFPNANTRFRDGIEPGTKQAEIHYCKTCRLKREQWIHEHKVDN